MPFKKELFDNKSFVQVGNHFELSPEYIKDQGWRFKKITATRLGGVLALNPFSSAFKTWCAMVNIYEEKMDPIVAKVGTVIEPKVREYMNKLIAKKTGIDFKYAEYKTKNVNYDCWKGINQIFGGIPDGEPYLELPPDNTQDPTKLAYNKGLPLLEIKTTSVDSFRRKKDPATGQWVINLKDGQLQVKEPNVSKEKWINKLTGEVTIPLEYKYQIGLYMYLRNVPKGILACCFVDTKDYLNPENVIVNKDNLIAQEISFDRKEMEQALNKASEWYFKYIKTGISPEMTEEDKVWWEEQKQLIK